MPIQAEETDDIALSPERIEARLQKFFPNNSRYEIEYVNVYGAHQCVAQTFRKGRVLLAGDSAHVNNPIGGMGMNGGIHDGINLAGKLARVVHGEAGEELLDLYSRQRRHAAVKYVQAQTIANKRLMEERDPAVRAKNFDELKRTAENLETARAYMRRAALTDSLRDAAAVS
jgi:2-polyprenyl-6-methoxyphenol hydroxylase-like FAD-dependent oxidoreductase